MSLQHEQNLPYRPSNEDQKRYIQFRFLLQQLYHTPQCSDELNERAALIHDLWYNPQHPESNF